MQFVETLQQRLRVLSKQGSAVKGEARSHLHARQLERFDEIRRLRQESKTQEPQENKLALTYCARPKQRLLKSRVDKLLQLPKRQWKLPSI